MEKFVGPTTSQPSVGPHTEVDIETFQETFANSQTLLSVQLSDRELTVVTSYSVRSGSPTDTCDSHSDRSVGSR